jgi:hypothetical protein
MSISWGKRQRFKFSSCGYLVRWSPPMIPALYAITYKQDPKNNPKNHTVLYFGQADDLSERAPAGTSEVLSTWTSNGGDANELFIFVHPMPGSTLQDRSALHAQLLSEYWPDCNRY